MNEFFDTYGRLLDVVAPANTESLDDLTGEMEPVSRAIMRSPAVTITGLAVKARLARFNADHLWDENDSDADWDALCIRSCIDSVIELAGTGGVLS
jgi:hypothetical protein